MRKTSRIFLIALLLISITSYNARFIFAEEINVVDPTNEEVGYASILYDNDNGLPTSEANAIAETEEGFIWIGGYSGLIRYDGQNFERYDSTTGIASVISLFVDSKDRLWIGTNDSGVFVLKNSDLIKFGRDEGLRALSIREIDEDSEGNIFIASTRGIAYIDQDMVLHQLDEPLLNDAYIKEFKISDDDVIYGITNSGEVFVIKNKKLTSYYDSADLGFDNTVKCIYPDYDNPGYIYAGTTGSEMYYGKLGEPFEIIEEVDLSPLYNINSIKMVDGKLWFCADNGIGAYDKEKFSVLDNIPLTSSIEKMMVDYEGDLWFASSKQGVMKIVNSRFVDLFEQYNIEQTVVNATALYDDSLFIGSNADGLKIISKTDGLLDSYPLNTCVSISGVDYGQNDLLKMLEDKRIRSMINDSKGNLWISTYGTYGLIKLNNHNATCFTSADGMPTDRIRTVYERKDGSILVACTGGIAVIENDEIVKIYDQTSGINNTEILSVIETKNGDILAGTDGDGLYLLHDDSVTRYGVGDGLQSEIIMRVKNDNTTNICWIVTGNSIAYMDENLEVHTIKNFPFSNNFDMYENSRGEMWILSSNGIYVTKVDELIKNETLSPLYYSKSNGLKTLTNANSYSCVSEDGDLYICGATGVSKVNIEEPFETVSNLKMVVPYIECDNELIYPNEDGTYLISEDTQRLTIYAFVYNYSLINPLVTYHLDGFEDRLTTVERSSLTPINYTNLKGGEYNFVMKIKDPAGTDEQEIVVNITKTKAFYEEVWFYVLSVVVASIVIGTIVRSIILKKTKEYEKKNREQKTLIREITEAFAKIIDMKDKYTNGHSSRVAEYTAMLTKEMGYDEDTVEKYYNIALMHDLGKIGIPEDVLNKPGKLTDEEFNIIKSHSIKGYNVLKSISIMPELADGAGFHHERPDGKGYPRGLKKDEIPMVAQIIAVADTFDAMYSDRPYRKRMNFDKIVAIINEVSGTQLSKDVVDAFLRLVDKGELRDPNDDGGGSLEDIDNIREKYK